MLMPSKKWLIVDDDISWCAQLADHLKHFGYDCTITDSLSKAACMMENQLFDYVLVDVLFPGEETGLDFYAKYKDKVPKMDVFTAHVDFPEVERSLEKHGMAKSAVIKKEELLNRLDAIWNVYGK